MKFRTLFLIFTWISLIGLACTILTDFMLPILIALGVFLVLVMLLVPRRS
jgi:hypothetical protein